MDLDVCLLASCSSHRPRAMKAISKEDVSKNVISSTCIIVDAINAESCMGKFTVNA